MAAVRRGGRGKKAAGDYRTDSLTVLMDRLGGSALARRAIQNGPFTRALSRRYTGGANAEDAVAAFAEMAARGFSLSLAYLGGPADTPEQAGYNFGRVMSAVNALAHEQRPIAVNFSLDQIGYRVSDEAGLRNALRVAERFAELVAARKARTLSKNHRDHLLLETTGPASVDRTLELRTRLGRLGIPAAVTVAANLRRSADDVRLLISEGAPVRLVKGGYAASETYAWQDRADVDASFHRLARMLLSEDALVDGVYPILATHDGNLTDRLGLLLARNGWSPDAYEFEMYFGVRPAFQRTVRADGHEVRLYVPFGTNWWPYVARRLGEKRFRARRRNGGAD
jgi:proline dehydrogenase